MDQDRAREVAEEIIHPYFSHDEADALQMIREWTDQKQVGSVTVIWESERSNLGWVDISTWVRMFAPQYVQDGVMVRIYDGDGHLVNDRFIHMHNVRAVETALRELAAG